jgi:hypothetical protein
MSVTRLVLTIDGRRRETLDDLGHASFEPGQALAQPVDLIGHLPQVALHAFDPTLGERHGLVQTFDHRMHTPVRVAHLNVLSTPADLRAEHGSSDPAHRTRYAPPVTESPRRCPARVRATLAAVTLALAACVASGTDATERHLARAAFDLAALHQPDAVPQDDTTEPRPDLDAPSRTLSFGQKGYRRATIYGGIGVGLENEDAIDTEIALALGWFVAPAFEVQGELSTWAFFQEGDDAVGLSPAIVFRWHFLMRERWSVDFNAGIGPVFSSDVVPEAGTGVNFMPRIGFGFTHEIGARGARLHTGIRWHHISNARINGEVRNPDRDGVLAEFGVTFPF